MFKISFLILCISLPLLIVVIKGKTINGDFKLIDLSKILAILLAYYGILFFYHKLFGAELDSSYLYFYTSISIALTLAFIVAVSRYSPLKNSIKSLLEFPRFDRISTFYLVILCFIINISFSAFLLLDLFPNKVEQQISTFLVLQATTNPFYTALILVLTEIFAIVGEELVYRYFAINALRQKLKKTAVVIISSLIWTLGHVDFNFGIFITGIFLGYLYYKTESLSLCVVLHILYNFSVLSTSLYSFYKDIGSLAIPAYQYALALFACQIILYYVAETIFVKTLHQKQLK